MNKRHSAVFQFTFAFAVGVFLLSPKPAAGDDWPTYRHDQRRSGVSDERLRFPLKQAWVRRSPTAPQTAWTGPAKWDAWAGNAGLQSMRNFDPCFFVTATGNQVFFGSSIDDAVHALDAGTGKENWVHFTGSAVRFPPTLANGNAWFGSDDGFVYCCDQRSGELAWKRAAFQQDHRITSNRKIMSLWPVRTGVLLDGDKVIFAGSLVPWEKSYLWKIDAETGRDDTNGCFQKSVDGVTLQGAMLSSTKRLYIPQGRAAPLAFGVTDGKFVGAIGEAGGVFCVLTEDEMLLAGPQDQKSPTDQIRVADATNRKRVATFAGANRVLVQGKQAWVPANDQLRALDRTAYVAADTMIAQTSELLKAKKIEAAEAKRKIDAAKKAKANAWRWSVSCPNPSGFIKAGNMVMVGLSDEVRVFNASTGKLAWSTKVDGVVYGLAVANGRLFVSTGLGHIYAFAP